MDRLNILPDARLAEVRDGLKARLSELAAMIRPSNFDSLMDQAMETWVRRGFAQAGADEGTIWLVDEEEAHLVPAYNTGPNADKMVRRFKQPLDAGLICMVFASEQPFVENEVARNASQSRLLDELLGVRTQALMAVPFYFQNECRGVISSVQLGAADGSPAPGFRPEDLIALQESAGVLSRLIDFRLLSRTLGL